MAKVPLYKFPFYNIYIVIILWCSLLYDHYRSSRVISSNFFARINKSTYFNSWVIPPPNRHTIIYHIIITSSFIPNQCLPTTRCQMPNCSNINNVYVCKNRMVQVVHCGIKILCKGCNPPLHINIVEISYFPSGS